MTEIDILKSELNKYLETADEKADQVMARHRSKAEKLIKDVERRFAALKEEGTNFEEAVTPESNVMDKYSNNISEKIKKIVENIQRPSKITHRSLEAYLESIRDNLQDLDKTLIKYVQLLKGRKYGRRVKSLSGTLKRLNGAIRKLEKFVKVDYAPSSEIELTSVLIEETLELIDDFETSFGKLESKEEEVKVRLKEINQLKAELHEYINHPSKLALEEAISNFETSQREIDHAFSNVRKVLRKYGKVMAKEPEVDSALVSNLVTDAATTMGNMSSSSNLQTLLVDLEESLTNPTMNLNKDKRDTAKADIQKLLSGDLEKYYSRSNKILQEKKQREKELEEMDLENKIDQLETSIAGAERDKARIYQREYRRLLDLKETITENIEEIKDTIANLSTVDISSEISLPEFPEWVESSE